MSKHPALRRKNALVAQDAGSREVVAPSPIASSWFNFRYSYTEISTRGPGASVKHNEVRFEDGTLKSESFEGTVDARALGDALRQAQAHVLHQSGLLLRSLFWFLPGPAPRSPKTRDDQDVDPDR